VSVARHLFPGIAVRNLPAAVAVEVIVIISLVVGIAVVLTRVLA